MKDFLSIQNVDSIADLVQLALDVKKQPLAYKNRGMGKTLGLVFFNPSLRTRMSSQKAAYNLGMNVIVMNINSDGWALEWEDGTVMDEGSQEHIKEAAGVLSQYCDIIGVRSFPSLKSRCDDYSEKVIRSFKKHASKPIISLESATRHPLQGFTDLVTILERSVNKLPRVVLTWAPHPKVLPQAVANSFVTWMKAGGVLLSIANPPGFDLDPELTKGVEIYHDQAAAFKNADYVYAKNWSSYENYGMATNEHHDWIVNTSKMDLTNNGKFMHCLPVRRNVVVEDTVLDSSTSLVLEQANNRTYTAQAVLIKLLAHA